MSVLANYTAAIATRLGVVFPSVAPPTGGEALQDTSGDVITDTSGAGILGLAGAGDGDPVAKIPVLIEDANDLETQIQKAINDTGMLVLIGMPTMDNTQQSSAVADLKITSAIAVGENPTLWRDTPLTKPVCLDVVHSIITTLQGFLVPGFAKRLNVIRVDFIPDKKRQLYEITIESRAVIDVTR